MPPQLKHEDHLTAPKSQLRVLLRRPVRAWEEEMGRAVQLKDEGNEQ